MTAPDVSVKQSGQVSEMAHLLPVRRAQLRKASPRCITLDLPPALAARVTLVCAAAGVSREEFIIDVLSDALIGALDAASALAARRAAPEPAS